MCVARKYNVAPIMSTNLGSEYAYALTFTRFG